MSSTSVSKVDREAVQAALGDAKTVLLLASDQQYEANACGALLSVAAPEDAQYLSVTLDDSPDDRLEEWRTNVGDLPSETGIIAVGETTRSAAAAASPSTPSSAPVTVDTVANPSDLTGLAIAIGAYLDAWADTDRTPVVCFHSISSLLFHADQSRVYRFLHSSVGRLRNLGAVAHYHLDPVAYDDSTVNRFSALFDAVVEIGDDGSVTVKKRR
jgi:hypothetical protein